MAAVKLCRRSHLPRPKGRATRNKGGSGGVDRSRGKGKSMGRQGGEQGGARGGAGVGQGVEQGEAWPGSGPG